MPFLGRDWRSPGDQWVRTRNGWEKLRLWRVKVFENLNESLLARLMRLAIIDVNIKDNDFLGHRQPHIHYAKGTTKESKVLTCMSEAFIRLDMSAAVKDVRRFNYVCKVLQILLGDKFASMSGTSQKQVLGILEVMVNQALKSNMNVPATRKLANQIVNSLNDGRIGHIGSESLWRQHRQGVSKMLEKLETYTIKQRSEDGLPTFDDLPEDCVRCILSRLSDHKDIVCTGMTNSKVYDMASQNSLWKNMCFFHFTDRQLIVFLPKELDEDQDRVDWKYIYRRCVKRFGKKDVYADTIAICCLCDSLFWKSIGHPCVSEEPPRCRTLSPEAFVSLFNI